jgi:hypothetical protein
MFGILCWVWSEGILHRGKAASTVTPSTPPELMVVAGTVVDQATNLGIGRATITVDGQSSTTEDSGNFRIVLPATVHDRVHVSVTRDGYFEADHPSSLRLTT